MPLQERGGAGGALQDAAHGGAGEGFLARSRAAQATLDRDVASGMRRSRRSTPCEIEGGAGRQRRMRARGLPSDWRWRSIATGSGDCTPSRAGGFSGCRSGHSFGERLAPATSSELDAGDEDLELDQKGGLEDFGAIQADGVDPPPSSRRSADHPIGGRRRSFLRIRERGLVLRLLVVERCVAASRDSRP